LASACCLSFSFVDRYAVVSVNFLLLVS
jgi:hypothetical protein